MITPGVQNLTPPNLQVRGTSTTAKNSLSSRTLQTKHCSWDTSPGLFVTVSGGHGRSQLRLPAPRRTQGVCFAAGLGAEGCSAAASSMGAAGPQHAPCPPHPCEPSFLPLEGGKSGNSGSSSSLWLHRGAFLGVCDSIYPTYSGNYRPRLIFRNTNTADQVSGMCFRTGTRFHCRDTTVKMLWSLLVYCKALI